VVVSTRDYGPTIATKLLCWYTSIIRVPVIKFIWGSYSLKTAGKKKKKKKKFKTFRVKIFQGDSIFYPRTNQRNYPSGFHRGKEINSISLL